MCDIPVTRQAKRVRDLALLPRREQDIASHTHHERRGIPQAGQTPNQILGRPRVDRYGRRSVQLPRLIRTRLLRIRQIRQRQTTRGITDLRLGSPALRRSALVLEPQIEQIHRLADVQQTVRVVREAELLAGVVEVGLDEEIGAQRGRLGGVGPPAAEALLPLRARAVGDGGDLAGELHAGVGRDPAVVEPAVPVGVHHQDLALRVAHGDAVGVAPRAAADGDDAADARREQHARRQRLHPAHAGPHAGVEPRDPQVVQEPELRAHHVLHRQDREPRRVPLPVRRVHAAGPRRPEAPPDHVRADHEVLVGVDAAPGPDELLPPPGLRVRRRRPRVR